MHLVFLFIVFLVVAVKDLTRASVTIELQFLRFENPYGRENDGSYCEGTSLGTCDNYFRICVKSSATKSTDFANCEYSKKSNRPRVESLDVDFQSDYTGIPKTITRNNPSWPGNIGFYMEVWDHDTLSGDDLIDKFNYRKVLTPGFNGAGSLITETILGWKSRYRTTLKFTLKVFCNRYYYGSSCIKYCKVKDDATGHYQCDNNGDHICLNDWYKTPNCLTNCAPSDDDVAGHFTCNSSGSPICRKDWYNPPGCLTKCVPRDDDTYGHFVCDSTGSRVCKQHWYNHPNCTKYCKSYSDPLNGYYTCNSTGDRVCIPGGYGSNCSLYCLPRDDNHGHYNCSEEGVKICHDHWYGRNCTKYCSPENDDVFGHFNCSNDGHKICYQNYYGNNCSTFCLADNVQYQCNKTTGMKECLGYWTGDFCNISSSVFSTPVPTTLIRPSLSATQPSFSLSTRLSVSANSQTKISWPRTAYGTAYSSSSSLSSVRIANHSSYYVIATELLSHSSSLPSPTITTEKLSLTSDLKHSSSIHASLSWSSAKEHVISVHNEHSTMPTMQASQDDRTQHSGIDWLLKTKNGHVVLGGASVGLLLLICLTVAIVQYRRFSKGIKGSNENKCKIPPDEFSDDFSLDNIMKNAHTNPLYVALEDGKKPRGNANKETRRSGVNEERERLEIENYEYANLGVIENPLFRLSTLVDDETGV